MAATPSPSLLALPPLRPSPTKQPSFGRSASAHNVHHHGASSATPGTSSGTTRRGRSSSIVSVQEVPETYDDQLDQGALTNVNAEWVNAKGTLESLPRSPYSPASACEQASTCLAAGRALAASRATTAATDLGLGPFPSSRFPLRPPRPRTGAWLIHVVLIGLAIVLLETIPGMSQDLTWTIVNLGYLFVSLVQPVHIGNF